MAAGVAYVVFLLPVVLSFIFGGVVLGDVLQEPDRELQFYPSSTSHDTSMQILGLESRHQIAEPVIIEVLVLDDDFDCGDLYITVRDDSGIVLTQRGFFDQCLGEENLLPVDDKFSEMIEIPGRYEIMVELFDRSGRDSLVASETFAVS